MDLVRTWLVNGPVAMMVGPSGTAQTSSRLRSINGWQLMREVISAAKASRSMVRAAPPGSECAQAVRTSRLPSSNSSRLRMPRARSCSRDPMLLLQTSSARRSPWCALVRRTGRISYRTTDRPRSASCQAASQPARPPPMIVIVGEDGDMAGISQTTFSHRARRKSSTVRSCIESTTRAPSG